MSRNLRVGQMVIFTEDFKLRHPNSGRGGRIVRLNGWPEVQGADGIIWHCMDADIATAKSERKYKKAPLWLRVERRVKHG